MYMDDQWPNDAGGRPLPRDTPSACADCDAPISLGALILQTDGRRVCVRCSKEHRRKAEAGRQGNMFCTQDSLF